MSLSKKNEIRKSNVKYKEREMESMKNMLKIQTILPWLLLLGTISLYFIYYVKYIGGILDADMSSELVLSELLAREHSLISKNWLYSTEIRVLNTQLVYSFFFLFTHNYMVVRVASRFAFIIILGLCFFYFCYQAGLKKWAPYLAAFLFLPFSRDYAEFVLLGDYYIPHIAISFLSLGLVFKTEKGSGKSKIIAFVFLMLLSFIAGLGGPRQVFIFYLPLLLTALLRAYQTHRFELKSVYPAFLFSAIGYFVNAKILSKAYSFSSWESLNFQGYSMDMFGRIIDGVLKVLGYCEGEVFSYNMIRNLVCFAILAGFVLYVVFVMRRGKELPEEEKVTFLYFSISVMVFTLLYVFSNMNYEERYLLPIFIFLVPLLGMSLEYHNWHPMVQIIVSITVFILVLASGLGVYKDFITTSNPDTLKNISVQLAEEGYESGYATYWNGNLMREFSNGKIDMYCWEKDIEEIIDVDMMFEWLQEKSHIEKKPQGKVFILLSKEQIESCPLLRYQIEDRIIIEEENYRVYGFDNYEYLISRLSTYTYDLSKTEFLNAGEYTGDAWILPEAGTTRGPHMTLYTGVYYITVVGENLGNLQMTPTADFGEKTLEAECIEQSDSRVVYEVNVYENTHFTEFIMLNAGAGTMKVSGAFVERGVN